LGEELDMYFQADDDRVIHEPPAFERDTLVRGLDRRPDQPASAGRLVFQSVARSKTRAVRSRFSSANAGASNCSPMGRPDRVNPHGMLTPGIPARLAVIV